MVNTRKKRDMFPFNSCAKDTNFGGYWWYSSDEDDETDTLFSSKSLSSDSSRSRRRHRSRRKNHGGDRSSDMGVMPLQGKVKDTFAVVKRSSDPYNDFRTSMVEMIVEKQIFSPGGLENLLQCFLSLNSYHHHKIIVEVFTEIWEALFSDWLWYIIIEIKGKKKKREKREGLSYLLFSLLFVLVSKEISLVLLT